MQVITANSLGDGRVVFQTPTGWSHDIDRADVLENQAAIETAMTRANLAAAQNRVVEPYAIDVVRSAAGIQPKRLRERIRAEGPTTGNSISKDAAPRGAAG